MKIFVKTLKGTHFEIEVKPEDAVTDVKKNIEAIQGKGVYPAEQQMLIHQGKILKDDTTLQDNKVAENSFIVIMLTKTKGSSSGSSTASTTPASQALPPSTVTPNASAPAPTPAAAPPATMAPVPATTPTPSATTTPASAVIAPTDVYGQAASNLVAGNALEQTIQNILDMGGGTWDRDTVVRALRAAYNNPERAVEYLYSVATNRQVVIKYDYISVPKDLMQNGGMTYVKLGIPEQAEAPPVAQAPTSGQMANPPVQAPQPAQALQPAQAPQPAQPAVPSSGPNANPLDLFPQGLPSMGSNASAGSLDFLRNSPQFRALQTLVQANPQILQPMLQELGKQNPQVMRLIQEHQAEFLRLLNEPAEGAESNLLGQLAGAMPQALTVTPEEREAIERLEAMGFDRALVLEVFFACNKNEELAANYLLDHMHEFED